LDSSIAARDKAGADVVCRLPDGEQVIWKAHRALASHQDAGLRFEVRDAEGRPVQLEPYMGMLSHVALLRADGKVFAHLHPSGNISMAAQTFFDAKLARETGDTVKQNVGGSDAVCSTSIGATLGGVSTISMPYEFPTPGDYRHF
jgi:hypothetical protein